MTDPPRIVESLDAIPAGAWDRLHGGNPTLAHAFLDSLHRSGCASPATLACGIAVFCVTPTMSVAEQPLAGLVSSNWYSPGASTTGLGELAPLRILPF